MHDSPLTEVAALLPTEAAMLLSEEDPAVQTFVCSELRSAICFWEERGVMLDAIQFDVVVTAMTTAALTSARVIHNLLLSGEERAQ